MECDDYEALLEYEQQYQQLLCTEETMPTPESSTSDLPPEEVIKDTSTHIKGWGSFWNEDEQNGIAKDQDKIIENNTLDVKVKWGSEGDGCEDVHTGPKSTELTEAQVMDLFAKQEQQFKCDILNMQPRMRPPRKVGCIKAPPMTGCAPSGGSPDTAVSSGCPQSGLEHLEQLVCLMGQLGKLQEQNRCLKRRCLYLKDTQSLLRLQNRQLLSCDLKQSRRVRTRGPLGSIKSSKVKKVYLSDSSDCEAGVPEELRSRPLRLSQRSYSVGSINEIQLDAPSKVQKAKGRRHLEGSKEGRRLEDLFSRSGLTSKWQQVKAVFSGKPESTTKAEVVTAEQLVRANSKHPRGLTCSKSYDAGMLTPYEDLYRDSTPSAHVYSSQSVDSHIPSVVTGREGMATPPADSGLDLEGQASSVGSSLLSEESDPRGALRYSPRSDDDPSNKFLTVCAMPRRQSSPTLVMQREALQHEKQRAEKPERSPRLSRSSSFQTPMVESHTTTSPDMGEVLPHTPDDQSTLPARHEENRRTHRTAWGRVKDIIHTRKDSLKRRNGRSHSAGDSLLDGSMSDSEYFLLHDEHYNTSQWDSSMPRSSSKHRSQCRSRRTSSYSQPTSPERPVPPSSLLCDVDSPLLQHRDAMAAVAAMELPANLSEEFYKKLQDWEEKKKRESHAKVSGLVEKDNHAEEEKFTEEFIRKMEEWERIKGHDKMSAGSASPAGCGSPDVSLSHATSAQELLSESFTRTVKVWERVKTQRLKDCSSPSIDGSTSSGLNRKSRSSRKKDRSKSQDRLRDRSRSKYDRQRKKEIQAIEKTQQKIEKEQEKLGRMKQRLEKIETMSEAEVQGLSQEFTQKLREWEIKKGLKPSSPACGYESSPGGTLPASSALRAGHPHVHTGKHLRSNSAKTHKEKLECERTQAMAYPEGIDISIPGGLDNITSDLFKSRPNAMRSSSVPLLSPCITSDKAEVVDDCTSIDLNLTAPLGVPPEGKDECTSIDLNLTADPSSYVDECTSIDMSLGPDTPSSMADMTHPLLEELAHREENISGLQHEISQLTERINDISQEHQKQIEHYKRELWLTSQAGHYSIQSDLINANLAELRGYLEVLQSTQQQAESDNRQLQALLDQEVQAKMAAERQVIAALQPRDEAESEQGESFDKLCNFLQQLHVQLGELKLGVGERDSLLGRLQQQLICQEVNNRLLEVELQRSYMELEYLREARRAARSQRAKTFAGTDFIQRGEGGTHGATHGCVKPSAHRLQSIQDPSSRLKHCVKSLEDLSLDWLNEIATHRQLFKSPPVHENHETQTEAAAAEVASQTNMSLCAKMEQLKSTPMSPPQITSSPVRPRRKQYIGSMSTPVIFPMPTPLRTPRVKHIAFGSTELVPRPEKPSPLRSHDSDDVDCKLNITSSLEAELQQRPVSDGICMENGYLGKNKENRQFGAQSYGSVSNGDLSVTSKDEEEPILPLSPVIRSRNPRKLKTDIKLSQISADAHVLHATPPKRSYQHRKVSCDTKADGTATVSAETSTGVGGTLSSGYEKPGFSEDCQVQPAIIHQQWPTSLSLTTTDTQDPHSLRPPTEHFSPRSPSPTAIRATHSPVHILKTAGELMYESETLKRARKNSQKLRSSCTPAINIDSPGKENTSLVTEIKTQLSHESSPEKFTTITKSSIASTSASVQLAVRRLSSSATEPCSSTPPLKDVTNDSGKVQAIKAGLLERISPERPPSVSSAATRISERPLGGTVSKRAEMYESKSVQSDSSKSPIATPLTIHIDPAPDISRKDSRSSPKCSYTKSSSSLGSQSPSPVSSERKVHRLFSRKYGHSPSSTDEGEGAVSALCRHAVSVEILDPEPEAEPLKTPDADHQKKKGFQWLQKPKKFFKVSNEHDEDQESLYFFSGVHDEYQDVFYLDVERDAEQTDSGFQEEHFDTEKEC